MVREVRTIDLKGLGSALSDIIMLIISTIILVIFGLIFYMVNLWIIKVAADILEVTYLTGDMVILSAAILTAAAMIGSISKKT